jgi:hypothetical protein
MTETTQVLPEAPPDPGQVDDMFAGLDAAIRKDQEAAGVPKDTGMPDASKEEAPPKEEPKADEGPKLKLGSKEEKPAEPAPEEVKWDDTAPVPRKREEWDKFREARNKEVTGLTEKLKAYEAKLAELEPKAADLGSLEELKAKVQTYEQQIQEATVLNDPQLTADLDARLKHALSPAKSTLDEKAAAEFEQLAALPPGKHRDKLFGELVDDMPAWQQAKLATVLATADMINGERSDRLANAKANAAQYLQQKAQQQQAMQAEVQKRNNLLFDSTVSELKQQPGFKDIFNDEGFAKQWVESARNVFAGNTGDAKVLANKALMAEIAQPLMAYAIEQTQSAESAKAKIAELEAELKKYASASPTPNTSTPSSPTQGDDPFMDGLMRAYNA